MKGTLALFIKQQKITHETLIELQERVNDVIQSKECYKRDSISGDCRIEQDLKLMFTIYPNEHTFAYHTHDKFIVYMQIQTHNVLIVWSKTKTTDRFMIEHIENIRDHLNKGLNYVHN